MSETQEAPRVFISYSWSNAEHIDWVINLAERLTVDGVHVTIDKWDLKEGHDKFDFMESMVKSTSIDKVLIILDEAYSDKANLRSGGVGTETQIISPEVYANVAQEKFIPIVAERDEDGNSFIPTYLTSRIYIDLSAKEHYEENYDSLLRNIHNRPAFTRPKLGKAPSHLFEETLSTTKVSSIVRSFDSRTEKNPKIANTLTRDFLSEFYESLKDYAIDPTNNHTYQFGKEIFDSINSYTPLRNEFISFFDKLTKSELDIDVDIIIRFLEQLPLLTYPQEDTTGSFIPQKFDNFKFYIHELFLYLIAISLKNENFKLVEELLYSSYFFKRKYNQKNEPERFTELYSSIESINDFYNHTYSQQFLSPMADLMITRIPENMLKDHLIDADLLCHYIAKINTLGEWGWFPLTYVYKGSNQMDKVDVINRLVSMRHFHKVKGLFEVNDTYELQRKLNETIKKDDPNGDRLRNARSRVPRIDQLIKIESIGTTR